MALGMGLLEGEGGCGGDQSIMAAWWEPWGATYATGSNATGLGIEALPRPVVPGATVRSKNRKGEAPKLTTQPIVEKVMAGYNNNSPADVVVVLCWTFRSALRVRGGDEESVGDPEDGASLSSVMPRWIEGGGEWTGMLRGWRNLGASRLLSRRRRWCDGVGDESEAGESSKASPTTNEPATCPLI